MVRQFHYVFSCERVSLLFTVPFTVRQGLPEAYKTPRKAVIDLGTWYFLLLVPLFIVGIIASVRLATERLGRATGCCPPGLCLRGVQEGKARFPQGPQPTMMWPWLIRATRLCTFLLLSNEHLTNLQMGFVLLNALGVRF